MIRTRWKLKEKFHFTMIMELHFLYNKDDVSEKRDIKLPILNMKIFILGPDCVKFTNF